MANWIIALLVAVALGFLAGLGVGGGSLLVLWLTLVLDQPASEVRIINLLFFLPTAVITSFIRWRKKQLDLRGIWPAAVAGCLAAVLFTWIGGKMDTQMLRLPFGAILVITGLREIFYRPRKDR